MTDNKLTLDDIFNDDVFSTIEYNSKKASFVKTEEERLIDEFEEINAFIDKYDREPKSSSMSEFGLLAKLKSFRKDDSRKVTLKPYDRHNLLGHIEIDTPTLEDIFNDDSGILDSNNDSDIFNYKHIPKEDIRARTDYVAKRKPMSEREFAPYEKMFHQVHHDLKSGQRKIIEFKDLDKQLSSDNFYLIDGVMIYLESVELGRDSEKLSRNTTRRKDGRTRTIFENGTLSNMYYRSVGKAIDNGGRKMISRIESPSQKGLFVESSKVVYNDEHTGWIYVLKSKSEHPSISRLPNLHKIGFSTIPIKDRIKNAKNEATYLFSDVKILSTYQIVNRNADKLERLLHKVFAKACLDVEFTSSNGQRINPREWFIVPFNVIEEAISLIINENIINYEYDVANQVLRLK